MVSLKDADKGMLGRTTLGYALLLLCEFACVHSATVFARTSLPDSGHIDLFGILVLAAELVVFVAGAGTWQHFARRAQQALIGIACLLAIAGLVCVFLLEALRVLQPDALFGLLVAAAVTLGLGIALYSLAWARVFSGLSPKELYRRVIFSYLVGLLLYLLLMLMPTEAVVPLALVAVMGSAALFASIAASSAPAAAAAADPSALTPPVASPAASPAPSAPAALSAAAPPSASATAAPPAAFRAGGPLKRVARLLWRPVLCTAAFGFMSGLTSQISAQGRLPLESFQQTSILASLIVVGILLLPALILSKPPDITTAYRIALPITAAGFMLLPFVWDTLFGLANALVNMGLMVVSIILWCMLASTTAQTRLPAQVVFGACLAVTIGARLLGKVLGFVYESHLTQDFLSLAAVALVSIYLLSMLSLVLFKGQRFTRGHEAEGEGLKVVVWGEDRYRECCGDIARTADFTPREFEVLLLLGQGRSIASVSKCLFVSENTTKSHIRSIYQKLGIHSKQELIDLVGDSLGSLEKA
ncbi:MAG: helix-turn-helix transcriptional regulator [Coriobacteriales bacterium]|jgi:DNA-binding CsgD family transcriptional regulator|nr:helix-turn-helix transcriptional regulator [Coriobacteriales bacterium]